MNSWGMEWNLDTEQRERMRRAPGGSMFDVMTMRWPMSREQLEKHLAGDGWLGHAAAMTVTRPPEPGEMAEAARRVVHVQRLFRPVFPKPLPRQFFAPCSGA